MPRTRGPASLSVLLLGSLAGGAAAEGQTPATLRTTSRIVYVDVVVRDGNGNVVHGLPETAFHLTENRAQQRINLFEEHTGTDRRTPLPAPEAAEKQYSNAPAGVADASLNIVLFDLLNTAPVDQAYARTRMIGFLRALPPGRQVALFVLSDRLHMIQGFTQSSDQLVKAAELIDVRQLNRTKSPNQVIADTDQVAYFAFGLDGARWGTAGAGPAARGLEKALTGENIQNLKVRLDATYSAFQQIANAVNGFTGRKNLYWLAGQFPSSTYASLQSISGSPLPSSDLTSGSNRDPGQSNGSGLAMGFLNERADRAIADSQIAVYPISVVGVQTDLNGAENSGIGSAGEASAQTASLFFNERQNSRSAKDNIADETGGEAFYGNNDPGALLRRGFEDGENFYILAYQPTDHHWDNRYRTIAVKLASGGYHLSYRRGYYAFPEQPTGNAAQQFAAAMRLESPPSSMLLLRANPPTASAGVATLDTTLDLRGIGFTASDAFPGGSGPDRQAKLQVLLTAYPRGGSGKPVGINSLLNLSLTPEDYAHLLVSGLPLHQTMHLPPGVYALRLGVVDAGNGRIGTLTVPLTLP